MINKHLKYYLKRSKQTRNTKKDIWLEVILDQNIKLKNLSKDGSLRKV